MIYAPSILHRHVDLIDEQVSGRFLLPEEAIDDRTFECFILYIVFLFSGFSVVSSSGTRVVEFIVWIVAGAPLVPVFVVRYLRVDSPIWLRREKIVALIANGGATETSQLLSNRPVNSEISITSGRPAVMTEVFQRYVPEDEIEASLGACWARRWQSHFETPNI